MKTLNRNSKYIDEQLKNIKFSDQLDTIIHSMIISEAMIKVIISGINSQSKPLNRETIETLKKVKELANVANSATSGIIDSIINNQKN